MSDDRFETPYPPPMRKLKEVAQTAFDRAQKDKFENVVEGSFGTCSTCSTCSGSEIEQYRDESGYNVARRCTRCGGGTK
jgi:hypothetical protein